MEIWLAVCAAVVGTAALITAVGVIWVKVLRPGANLVSLMGIAVPLLKTLINSFEGEPHLFEVLHSIASEFQTNDGSTLKDTMNRLEVAAASAKLATEEFRVQAEAAKQLAADDRKQLMDIIIKLNKAESKGEILAETAQRTEHAIEMMTPSPEG